jgi:hypothetical protein
VQVVLLELVVRVALRLLHQVARVPAVLVAVDKEMAAVDDEQLRKDRFRNARFGKEGFRND